MNQSRGTSSKNKERLTSQSVTMGEKTWKHNKLYTSSLHSSISIFNCKIKSMVRGDYVNCSTQASLKIEQDHCLWVFSDLYDLLIQIHYPIRDHQWLNMDLISLGFGWHFPMWTYTTLNNGLVSFSNLFLKFI